MEQNLITIYRRSLVPFVKKPYNLMRLVVVRDFSLARRCASRRRGKLNSRALDFLLHLARESSSSLSGNFFNFTQKVLHLRPQSSSSFGVKFFISGRKVQLRPEVRCGLGLGGFKFLRETISATAGPGDFDRLTHLSPKGDTGSTY